MKNFTRLSVFAVLLFSISAFAQSNGTVTCNPISITGDDGSGSLDFWIPCHLTWNGAGDLNAYLSGEYEFPAYTLKAATNVTFITGHITSDGSRAGWVYRMFISYPSSASPTGTVNKKLELIYNSIPAPDAMDREQWPMSIYLPAGTTIKVEAYGYSNNAFTCVNGPCASSAGWTLQ
jgi:hypothetical protein